MFPDRISTISHVISKEVLYFTKIQACDAAVNRKESYVHAI